MSVTQERLQGLPSRAESSAARREGRGGKWGESSGCPRCHRVTGG